MKSLIDRLINKPEWQHPDPAVRAEAVLRLPSAEREVILGIAREDAEPRVRRAAAKKLSDVETLRRLFEAFSKKRLILDLLDRSIHAEGVQVFIGEESGFKILDDCSVVTAPYHFDDDTIGVLGVIGPTRMAYDRVVPIVDLTARLLRSAINPHK